MMTNRDRDSLKAFREELAEIERKETEERERPVREAVETLKTSHRKLAAIERERLTGTIPDPERWLDPAVGPDVRMTDAQAATFNGSQSKTYRDAHPEMWSPALVDLLAAYFDKEKIRLVTASMIEKLVERFASVGLLPERPAEPEPEPVIEEQPVPAIERETHVGIDPLTGEQREFTSREVALMSADQFRRCFRLTKAAMALPTHASF